MRICKKKILHCVLKIETVWTTIKIVNIPNEEQFFETAVGCNASYFVKIIWCSSWFCISWGSVLLYLLSQKGRCYSLSDDLSCLQTAFALYVTRTWRASKKGHHPYVNEKEYSRIYIRKTQEMFVKHYASRQQSLKSHFRTKVMVKFTI